MSEDYSSIAREKLSNLVQDLNAAASKLELLSTKTLPQDELLALSQLSDRVAIYLQDIVLMLADDSQLHIESVLEFVGLVEHCVEQISQIEV